MRDHDNLVATLSKCSIIENRNMVWTFILIPIRVLRNMGSFWVATGQLWSPNTVVICFVL